MNNLTIVKIDGDRSLHNLNEEGEAAVWVCFACSMREEGLRLAIKNNGLRFNNQN